jgi:beta-lactamase superfamily II metal-dependent hydrolase
MQPSLDDPAVGLYKEDGLHLTLKGYDTLGNAIKGILPAEVVKAREFEIHQLYLDNIIGDAYIFIAPDGKITLLDGGDSPQYKTCLRPALDRLGIRHIDQIIITHMHWDHYGAVIELLADQDISADRILWQTNYDWDLIKKTEACAYTAYQIHMRKLRNNANS